MEDNELVSPGYVGRGLGAIAVVPAATAAKADGGASKCGPKCNEPTGCKKKVGRG